MTACFPFYPSFPSFFGINRLIILRNKRMSEKSVGFVSKVKPRTEDAFDSESDQEDSQELEK